MKYIQEVPDLRGGRVGRVREGFPEEPTNEIGVKRGVPVGWVKDWGQGTSQAEGRVCSKVLVSCQPS